MYQDSSDGSAPYVVGRPRSTKFSTEDDPYETPRSNKPNEDIVCHGCGLFKDRHGYLILTSPNNGKRAEYFKPVAPPRPGDTLPDTRKEPDIDVPRKRGCGRLVCLLMAGLAILLLGSIGVNIYQFLKERTKTEETAKYEPPVCPQTVLFQAGSKGTISCSLQYTTPGDTPSIEIYQIGAHDNTRTTYMSLDQAPTNELLQRTIAEASIDVDFRVFSSTGLVHVAITYEQVRCCVQGDLYINISGNMLVKIGVNVDADTTCRPNHVHNVKTINTISCTRCYCGNTSALQSPVSGTWIYDLTNRMNATQPGRVTVEHMFNESTGLMTDSLVFNETACYDGGDYALIITDQGTGTRQMNFTVQISGDVSFDLHTSTSTAKLLTDSSVDMVVCIANEPSAFLSSHNVTYTFVGNGDSLEVLQAENTTVVANEGQGAIATIPAAQQNVLIDPYMGNAFQFRSRYENGVLYVSVYFNPVQCFHGGEYQLYVDSQSLYNLTVYVDDSDQRTQTTVYQLSEETGFVETYNITLECGAAVGCTKRAYTIEPTIDTANTTFNHTLDDVNDDGVMDVFVATITSAVVDIPMTLNNTQFTCRVPDDDVLPQDLTYTIYVLEGTFCDTRAMNCEYVYPYKTPSTCALWVSCLNDRPRVKMCGHTNLYYHNDGQCAGTCEYGCPWSP